MVRDSKWTFDLDVEILALLAEPDLNEPLQHDFGDPSSDQLIELIVAIRKLGAHCWHAIEKVPVYRRTGGPEERDGGL